MFTTVRDRLFVWLTLKMANHLLETTTSIQVSTEDNALTIPRTATVACELGVQWQGHTSELPIPFSTCRRNCRQSAAL
jgi:hypothetical protein